MALKMKTTGTIEVEGKPLTAKRVSFAELAEGDYWQGSEGVAHRVTSVRRLGESFGALVNVEDVGEASVFPDSCAGYWRETDTAVVRLWGFSKEIETPVRALLFGQLVKLVQGTVEHYQSDLFHDAHWVGKHVNGPTEFFYAADKWGTAIGTDEGYVFSMRALLRYRVELVVEDGQWFAVIAKVGD